MSFVPAGPTKATENQDPVLGCVNCPVKALVKENGAYYCTHNFNVSKHSINKTYLGDVPMDVVDNCKACSVYQDRFQSKEVAVERSRVTCPLSKTSQSVRDCTKCACLDVPKTEDHLKTLNKDATVDKISCGFPHVNFKSLNIWFTPSKKKVVKEYTDNIRKITKEKK